MPHIHDKIDFTVEVFIVYKNKVLLRKHDKYKFWLSVGGHVELDEDPNQAAIREVKEEVGLDVVLHQPVNVTYVKEKDYQDLIAPAFMNRHRINEHHEHVTLAYFARANTDKISLSEEEVTEECRWFCLEDLIKDKEVKFRIKNYALAALKAFKE